MRDPMRRHFNVPFLALTLFVFTDHRRFARACIGGGGGCAACCPAASSGCAPSVPACQSYGSYSSYSAGGSYAAPQASYPRPYGYSAPCASSGCSAPAPSPCASSSSGGCVWVLGLGLAPLPPPPPPPAPSYGGNIPPPPAPGSDYEEHPAPAPYNGDQQPAPPQNPPYNEQNAATPPVDYTPSEGKQNYDNVAASEAPPQAKTIYDNNQHDYADETNTIGGSEPASVAPASADDTSALNCEDGELRKIVEEALRQSQDNLDAARKIESEAAARFGGRFNSIVSNSEFAYVNWYGKRNCQLRVNDRHSLTWED